MINTINLKDMRNAEYVQFLKGCASIVGANDPTGMNVQLKYDAFINKLAELEVLFKKSTENPITAEIEALDARRDRAVSGLLMHINALSFHFDPAVVTPAMALQHNLKVYTTNIAAENYNAETALINNLVTDWETKPELANALATLGITSWKDELKTANALFDERYIARTQDMATASPDNLKTKRLEGNTAYYELRDHINANMTLAPSLLLVKTTNEINALITQYNQLLANRKATDTTATQ
jgi:hypothetical protein